MSEQVPPTDGYYPGVAYNPAFFESSSSTSSGSSGVSQQYVDDNFLEKVGNPISTADTTAFDGQIISTNTTSSSSASTGAIVTSGGISCNDLYISCGTINGPQTVELFPSAESVKIGDQNNCSLSVGLLNVNNTGYGITNSGPLVNSGLATFNQLAKCNGTMPGSTDSSTTLPTTAWVQNAILAQTSGSTQNNLIASFAFTYIADGSKPTGVYVYNIYPNSSIITSYSRVSQGYYKFNFSQSFGASVKAVYDVAFSGVGNYGFMNCSAQLVAEDFANNAIMAAWTTQISSYGEANWYNNINVWVWTGGSNPSLTDLPYSATGQYGGYIIVRVFAQ